MDLRIENKLCLVTASSQGIGRACAESLARDRGRVVLTGRDAEKLEKVRKEWGEVQYFAFDLSDGQARKKFFKDFEVSFSQTPEIVVLNLGGPPKGLFHELTVEDWQRGFQTLFEPTLDFVKWVVPSMQQKKFGRIVIITSLAAKEPIGKMPISSALRSGIGNLVKNLSKDFISAGVTINAVLPGWTLTPAVEKMGISTTLAEGLPQKRLLRPEEIGDVVAFLCSDLASGITGQSILVDGGSTSGFF